MMPLHLLGRKGQCPPVPTGYCLPQISLRISFTGGTGVSPVVERQRQTLGETEAETGVSKQEGYGDEEEGYGDEVEGYGQSTGKGHGLHCSPKGLAA